MTKPEARQRIEKLRESINRYRYDYHVLDRSTIPDTALDSLKHELVALETQFPDFITPDSPSQRVSGEPLQQFKKVQHSERMLSLNDVFSHQELEVWLERIQKLIPGQKIDFYAEPKLDGLAVSLRYERSRFIQGATRGNGEVGEEVTQNLRTIESIPLRLECIDQPTEELADMVREASQNWLEVRGEVVISRKNFAGLNLQQKKRGLPPFANPRNLAAGSIRQLDPKLAASRRLDFVAYQVLAPFEFKTHQDEHRLAAILGFRTLESQFCLTIKDVQQFLENLQNMRDDLAFQTDGSVINVNDKRLWPRLGVVGKAPRYIIAYKFAAEEVTTRVHDIQVQVGRTGTLTPVAILEPVQVAGTTVSRATLHNEDEIKRKDVRIGDTVILHKAGDIIPEVIKVLPELRTGKEKPYRLPKTCPLCGSKVERINDEAAYRCTNRSCFGQERERIIHFTSRGAMDIDKAGQAVVDQLLEKQLIRDPADLYFLRVGDIASLDRFAEKSAQNLYQGIQASKQVSLGRFLYALGIRHIGEQTASDIAHYLASQVRSKTISVERLQKTLEGLSDEDWANIDGIGPIVADSLHTATHSVPFKRLLEKLHQAEIQLDVPEIKDVSTLALAGKTIVFTGALKSMTREEAEARVRELGGKASASVSKETDYIVAGTDPGSKAERARKLGVKIITESSARRLLKLN